MTCISFRIYKELSKSIQIVKRYEVTKNIKKLVEREPTFFKSQLQRFLLEIIIVT